ncbi:NAD dependent epimerase/dehydratase [Trichoderma harzianum]|uniref:NAD dependent epimerase/dehydratase n=1 Tax=Trichoderma harzianum TaxID=5544 RepID=A0A0G0A679_TRIHA|nr:NAD dependent epimerase/dehydratase [Trichoderma harzianum]
MRPFEYAIPPGSLVLVTGANGYIASHIVNELLELGFNVRGTVREEKPWLDRFFEEKYGKGRFESIVVRAMEDDKAFALAAEGASGVIHVASDGSFANEPDRVIPTVKNGTIHALQAASQSSVKRFVLTSSSVAAIIPETNKKGITIDESTWNDAVIELAWSGTAPENAKGYIVYSASKTEGERTAWDWVKENKPSFTLNTVLPNCNAYYHLYFVDVRDTARLHVAALLDPKIKEERIFAFAQEYNWTDVLNILRKLRPNRQFPLNPENEGRDYTQVAPRDKAKKILQDFFGQPDWVSLEESLAAGIEDLQ